MRNGVPSPLKGLYGFGDPGSGAGNRVSNLSRNAFFRYDFTSREYTENGKAVRWPGGWTQDRASAAYYSTVAGAAVAVADDVMRVSHFDVDEMVRLLLMERGGSNIFPDPLSVGLWPNAWNVSVDGQVVLETPTNTYHRVGNISFPATASTQYVAFFEIEPINLRYCAVRTNMVSGSYTNVGFDLQEETLTFEGEGLSGILLPAPSGGYVVALVATSSLGTVGVSLHFADSPVLDAAVPTYLGDASRGAKVRYANVQPGDYPRSPIASVASRDDDKLYRTDLASFALGNAYFLEAEFSLQYGDVTFPRAITANSGDATNRQHIVADPANGIIAASQFLSGTLRGTVVVPYVEGEMRHAIAGMGLGAGAVSLTIDGIFAGEADTNGFLAPTTLIAAASSTETGDKPDQAQFKIIGLHPGDLSLAERIDATAPVKSVKQIEGVTPLLDLWFEGDEGEGPAFSLDGKARGLSNILDHERAGEAYGLLSDGRIASHPDDYPRLTNETGGRAHLGEAEAENLVVDSEVLTDDGWTYEGYTPVSATLSNGLGGLAFDRASLPNFAIYDATNGSFFVAETAAPSPDDGRARYTFTTPAGCAAIRVYPFRNTPTSYSYFSVGVSPSTTYTVSWYEEAGKIGGFQLETGSYATSYIRTTGSAQSRAADLNSVDLTSLALDMQDGFCFLVDFTCPGPLATDTSYGRVFNLGQNLLHFSGSGTQLVLNQQDGGTTLLTKSIPHVPGDRYRVAGRFSAGQLAVSFNGGSVQTGNPGAYTRPNVACLAESNPLGGAKPAQILMHRFSLLKESEVSNDLLQTIAGALS